jgi:hypothetical protein
MTPIEPITNQELPTLADRVARSLIADMLAEVHTYLDDLIDGEIDKDPEAGRLDAYTHAHAYGLVWDRLGRAAAEYARRDEVLAPVREFAAATLPCGVCCAHAQQQIHAILAARTTTAQEQQ